MGVFSLIATSDRNKQIAKQSAFTKICERIVDSTELSGSEPDAVIDATSQSARYSPISCKWYYCNVEALRQEMTDHINGVTEH